MPNSHIVFNRLDPVLLWRRFTPLFVNENRFNWDEHIAHLITLVDNIDKKISDVAQDVQEFSQIANQWNIRDLFVWVKRTVSYPFITDAEHDEIVKAKPADLSLLIRMKNLPVDIRNSKGLTLLMRAAELGNEANVIELLLLGANAQLLTSKFWGSGVIDFARRSSNAQLVTFLEHVLQDGAYFRAEREADIACKAQQGRKAIYLYLFTACDEDPSTKARMWCKIGEIYEFGKGITKDILIAMFMYLIATTEKASRETSRNIERVLHGITAETAEVARKIGVIYLEKGKGLYSLFNTGFYNPKTALRWFQKAREFGSGAACRNIGLLYEQGLGVEKNKNIAAEYYLEAQKKRYPKIKRDLDRLNLTTDYWFRLGNEYYLKSSKKKQDFVLARLCYKKVIKLKSILKESNYYLGEIYENGKGVTPDLPLAIKYYQYSIENCSVEDPHRIHMQICINRIYDRLNTTAHAEIAKKISTFFRKRSRSGDAIERDYYNLAASAWSTKAKLLEDGPNIFNFQPVLTDDIRKLDAELASLENYFRGKQIPITRDHLPPETETFTEKVKHLGKLISMLHLAQPRLSPQIKLGVLVAASLPATFLPATLRRQQSSSLTNTIGHSTDVEKRTSRQRSKSI
jgi:TPR repeat protein